jgi:hypothetical protein
MIGHFQLSFSRTKEWWVRILPGAAKIQGLTAM